jgi:hypothetical protein
LQKFHEEWKGRIDPWQPRKKQRRKAAKSIKNRQQATGNDKGDAMSVPKVFCEQPLGARPNLAQRFIPWVIADQAIEVPQERLSPPTKLNRVPN